MIMKIVAFFQHMPPFTGGAALRGHSIITSLAHLLAEKKGSLTVYCTNSDPLSIPGVTIYSLDMRQVDNTMSLKRRLLGELQMGYIASRRMFSCRSRPSLALVSSPGYIAAIIQIIFSRLYGIPYILDVRDIYPQVYSEAKLVQRGNIFYRVLSYISQSMYINAELVLCATQGLAREIAREAPSARIVHIYNGFPSNLIDRRANKYSRFTVCFHGVLGFFQDVDTLLSVTKRLTEYDVDVVVIGYGRKEAPLQNSSLSNLKFFGQQSFEITISEVERCHLGLCLRLDDDISKDAFPVKVWEYIGLGIPCIITPPCEAGDFIKQHNCGVVLKSGDVDGIVTAVLKAKQDGTYLEAMSSNCRELATLYTRERAGFDAAKAIFKVASRFV